MNKIKLTKKDNEYITVDEYQVTNFDEEVEIKINKNKKSTRISPITNTINKFYNGNTACYDNAMTRTDNVCM